MKGMQGRGHRPRRWVRGLLVTCLLAGLGVVVPAAGASAAGEWVQVSCVNPNGTSAPSEGWSGSTVNPSGAAAPDANSQCDAASPMVAVISDLAPAPTGTSATLTYAPPTGSKLIGGTVDADLWAGGYSGGSYNALANAQFDEPAVGTNGFMSCNAINFSTSCPANESYSGQVQLPADAGGDLYAYASCNGSAGYSCNTRAGGDNAWSDVIVHRADLLLSSVQSPQGAGFTGSALNRRVSGTAHLVFTASEPSGPGIADVVVALDGHTVWQGSPSAGDASCSSVGNDPTTGAPMYDYAQPCPQSATADAAVPTGRLRDGRHHLAVTVIDAAQNAATVFDQTIVTANPQRAPVPRGRHAVRGRFVIFWTWGRRFTTLDRISVTHLPRGAVVSARCTGRGCPRLKVRSAGGRTLGRLLSALTHRRFRSGDTIHLTAAAPRHSAEHVRLTIRADAIPAARLGR